jgi:hypothetical protein
MKRQNNVVRPRVGCGGNLLDGDSTATSAPEARDGAGITLAEIRALLDDCLADGVPVTAALLAVDIELHWQ